jgi:DNA-binding GntR family transcriptional regulator
MFKIEHVDLTSRVYERIKGMILSGDLSPGKKIVQERLAKRIGVSRTPILRALQMLEHEFLVQGIPRRGVYVKEMQKEEILDAFDCREAIEGIAARLAAARISPDQLAELRSLFEPFQHDGRPISVKKYAQIDLRFHRLLIEASSNRILLRIEMLGNVSIICSNRGLVRPPEETLPEHLGIVEAISQHNGDLAEERVRSHIRRSRDRIAQSNGVAPAGRQE